MRFIVLVFLLLIAFQPSFSQSAVGSVSDKKESALYLTWGYHRNAYTTSNLHLKDYESDSYEFTLYHAKAKDKPDMHQLWKSPPTVPQYVFRVGYFFKNRSDLGIEFSWDHLKYVVTDYQTMHLKGWIHENYYDLDTLVTPDLVHFEHTNGNNYAMLSVVKRSTLFEPANNKHKLSVHYTGGAGILVPKTDSSVLGNHNDGPFRYSGIVFATSAGLRYEFFKYFYVEPSVKGAFADYTNAKVYLQGRAQHHFFSIQYVLAAGINYPIGN